MNQNLSTMLQHMYLKNRLKCKFMINILLFTYIYFETATNFSTVLLTFFKSRLCDTNLSFLAVGIGFFKMDMQIYNHP